MCDCWHAVPVTASCALGANAGDQQLVGCCCAASLRQAVPLPLMHDDTRPHLSLSPPTWNPRPAQCAEGCIYCFGAADNCYSGCSEGYGLVAKPENKGTCERCSVENCAQCAYRGRGNAGSKRCISLWHLLVRMACRKGQLRMPY